MTIESESKHIFNLLKEIFLLPWYIIMILLGKKHPAHILKPFSVLWTMFREAKVTFWLIIINVLIYIAVSIGDSIRPGIIEYFVNYPGDLFTIRIYTLLTSTFMHASLSHLFGNLLVLFILGRIVERELSGGKMLFFYIFSGAIASAGSSLVELISGTNMGGLGASGGIAGIIAASMLLAPFSITYIFGFPLPIVVAGIIFLITDISGIIYPDPAANIGYFAHLAGYLSATSMYIFFNNEIKKKMKKGLIINLIIIFFLILLQFI